MTTLEQLRQLSDDALIEKVGRQVMGWRGIPHCWVSQKVPASRKRWNPLKDWNHTREMEERLINNDDELRDRYMDFLMAKEELGHCCVRYLFCDQRDRCLAALLAVSR